MLNRQKSWDAAQSNLKIQVKLKKKKNGVLFIEVAADFFIYIYFFFVSPIFLCII